MLLLLFLVAFLFPFFFAAAFYMFCHCLLSLFLLLLVFRCADVWKSINREGSVRIEKGGLRGSWYICYMKLRGRGLRGSW